MNARSTLALVALVALCTACREAPAITQEPAPPATPSATAEETPAPASSAPSVRRDTHVYPWLGEPGVPPVTGDLEARFAPPAGFARVELEPPSFGAWLRTLPTAAAGTPVRSYDGSLLLPADDRRIAGVVALDVGRADLQQCADAVIRLHAEWSWSRGERDMSYRAASGLALPFTRWARGERIVAQGASIAWAPGSGPARDHAGFRKYLDAVFAWANTVSLEKQARSVGFEQIRPGDFFVLPGNPGHAVLVLDLAQQGSKKVALLGQSFMPAQNFQVLRPSRDRIWFDLDPERPVATPFWRPFPWSSLRRLD
jgi:hypothetical protein